MAALCGECCSDYGGWGILEPSLALQVWKDGCDDPSPKGAMHLPIIRGQELSWAQTYCFRWGCLFPTRTYHECWEKSLILMLYLLRLLASSDQSLALEHWDIVLSAFMSCWEKWGRLKTVIWISQQLGSSILWCSWSLIKFCRCLPVTSSVQSSHLRKL